MGKPVDNIDFWKERIKDAKLNGQDRYSVYITRKDDWEYLNEVHKGLIEQFCTGKVLDAGCGYGRACEWITNYTGVDFSPDFIEEAMMKYPNNKFVQADLRKLPFKDKEFDWAVAISVKHMIIGNMGEEAWNEMETEIKRVAKKFLILEYTDPDKYEIVWSAQ